MFLTSSRAVLTLDPFMHFAEVAILIRSGVGTRVATNTSFGGVPSQLASRLDPEAEHAKDQSR